MYCIRHSSCAAMTAPDIPVVCKASMRNGGVLFLVYSQEQPEPHVGSSSAASHKRGKPGQQGVFLTNAWLCRAASDEQYGLPWNDFSAHTSLAD